MKIKKSYPINKLNNKTIIKLLNLSYKYTSTLLGTNNRKRKELSLIVNKDNNTTTFGEYDAFSNTITINTQHSNTIEEFISTFIHEYTHYTQPIRTKYYKLLDQFGYEQHPHEIEARDNEKKLLPIIYNQIKFHLK